VTNQISKKITQKIIHQHKNDFSENFLIVGKLWMGIGKNYFCEF
jgi:hypothetical protein